MASSSRTIVRLAAGGAPPSKRLIRTQCLRPTKSTLDCQCDTPFSIRLFSQSVMLQSGHNKWSKIKHEKGAKDAKKAGDFTKISQEISEYVKRYGPDPKTNTNLRTSLDKAKKAGMSTNTIENAMKRGQGLSLSGKPLETVLIEGMTPSGVLFIVECTTDNKLRTLQDVRLIIRGYDCKLAPTLYQFQKKPFLHITGPEDLTPDEQLNALEEPLIEVPLEYVELLPGEKSTWEARANESETPHQLAEAMQKVLPERWSITKTGTRYYPQDTVEVDDESEAGSQLSEFLSKLEEENDVTEIHTNFKWKSEEPPTHAIDL